MALLLVDGFEAYSSLSDLFTAGPWTGGNNSFSSVQSVQTPFQYGVTLAVQGNVAAFSRNLGSNTSNTIYVSLRTYRVAINSPGANYPFGVLLYDASSIQVNVAFTQNGDINIYRNATLIGTFAGAHNPTVWEHFQIKIVIASGTGGEVRIRKNGSTTDSYVLTGVNTQNTANAYCNMFEMRSNYGNTNVYVDDLVVLDSSGTTSNTWPGDPRVYTLIPSGAGSSTQFTAPTALTIVGATSVATFSYASGNMLAARFLSPAPADGTLAKVTIPILSAVTGSMQAALYTYDVANDRAGTFIAATSTLVNPVAGNNDLTFSSPPTVTAGTYYYVAVTCNATTVYYVRQGYLMTGQTLGTWPSPYLGTVNSGNGMAFTYTYSSMSNYAAAQFADGDLYNYSSTVNNADMFAMNNLPTTPTSILSVVQRAVARKSDSGTRSLQTQLKSGATTVTGTSTALAASSSPLITVYDTDPATSAAWTGTAVNALEAGYKVSA